MKREKVDVLVIKKNRIIQEKKMWKINDRILTDGVKSYVRLPFRNDSFIWFINLKLEPAPGNVVYVDELYKHYKQFCEKEGLKILPQDKFIKKLEGYLEIEGDLVRNVKIAENYRGISTDKADIYLFKKGRIRKKYKPYYIVTEGVAKTVTLDDLYSYAVTDDGELVVFDDEMLNSIVGESIFLGATMGTQKLFRDLKLLIFLVAALVALVLLLTAAELQTLSEVHKMLKSLTQHLL